VKAYDLIPKIELKRQNQQLFFLPYDTLNIT